MIPYWWPTLVASVQRHEGCRLKPYRDSLGVLTIGWGRNLDANGITQDEADRMLDRDLTVAYHAVSAWAWFAQLSPGRQMVLVEMCFNLGLPKLLKFRRTLAACEAGRYDEAADAMLASKWAEQVKGRARTLAEVMRRG